MIEQLIAQIEKTVADANNTSLLNQGGLNLLKNLQNAGYTIVAPPDGIGTTPIVTEEQKDTACANE